MRGRGWTYVAISPRAIMTEHTTTPMKEYPSLHIGRRLSAIDCKIVGGSRTEEEKGRPYKVPTGPPLARAEPETTKRPVPIMNTGLSTAGSKTFHGVGSGIPESGERSGLAGRGKSNSGADTARAAVLEEAMAEERAAALRDRKEEAERTEIEVSSSLSLSSFRYESLSLTPAHRSVGLTSQTGGLPYAQVLCASLNGTTLQ
jgi:hypothetical protein